MSMSLRERYRWLYMLEAALKEDVQLNKGWAVEEIERTKRSIRRIVKRRNDDRKIVKSDDGYVVLLIEMPYFIRDEKMAEEWFEENERMECVPSQYDCTGQWFTRWHKVFRRNGKYMVYHGISKDI